MTPRTIRFNAGHIMIREAPTPATRPDRRLRLRVTATAALILLGSGLAGCGDPDDGGGGRYVAEQMTGQARV